MTNDRRNRPALDKEPQKGDFVRYNTDSYPDHNGERNGLHEVGMVVKTHQPPSDKFDLNVQVEYPTIDGTSSKILWSWAFMLQPATAAEFVVSDKSETETSPKPGDIIRFIDDERMSDRLCDLHPIGFVQSDTTDLGTWITLPAKSGTYRHSFIASCADIRLATAEEQSNFIREVITNLMLRK